MKIGLLPWQSEKLGQIGTNMPLQKSRGLEIECATILWLGNQMSKNIVAKLGVLGIGNFVFINGTKVNFPTNYLISCAKYIIKQLQFTYF